MTELRALFTIDNTKFTIDRHVTDRPTVVCTPDFQEALLVVLKLAHAGLKKEVEIMEKKGGDSVNFVLDLDEKFSLNLTKRQAVEMSYAIDQRDLEIRADVARKIALATSPG